jgi:Fe2+ transport system protein FeoA
MMKKTHPPTLDTLHAGETGTILALHAGTELYRRLAALGLRVGKHVRILRRGRFAGPLHIRVGTTDLMMRISDACCIQVQRSHT